MKRIIACVVLVVVAGFVMAPPAGAAPGQAGRPAPTGRLIITVVDPSRLVLRGATVTIVALDEAGKKVALAPVKSTDRGLAVFEGLPPGRYSVNGEFPGFEIGAIGEIRVKAGDNKHVLVLPLARITEAVTVSRDPQAAASDRGTTFGSALTREQVEALSDDPDEMARQLRDMAGPGATMRVDSFEGAQLPPKAMIKAIHITRDAFAAENHIAGMMFIDIITQPGIRPLSGGVRYSLYDSALDGRNPLVPKKGPARSQNVNISLGGTLLKDRSSFNISFGGMRSFTTPNLYAATSAGTVARNLDLRMPNDTVSVNGSLDFAVTKDQTLRLGFGWNTSDAENQGVGAYDLAERAYATERRNFTLRIQEAGPVGRRFFINTRFSTNWVDTDSTSATDLPTVYVLDAFRSGGAQRSGGQHTRAYSLQSDLDYVRNIHSVRLGLSLDGGTYRSDDASNYLGTYTFENLAAFEAGLPRTFTRRIGDPNISYQNWQAGFYLQDDIRVSKNLTISPGIRVEAQTHVKDANNIGPRFGITWAPFKSGKTTFRLSAGQFFDWLGAGTYEQTLRVDGLRQQELNIVNPAYPYEGSDAAPPTNKYLLSGDLILARNVRLSAGVDQQLTPNIRVNVVYADTRTNGLLTGRNLNAPVNGVRPNPTLSNVVEAMSKGRSESRTLSTNLTMNLAPRGGSPGSVTIGTGGVRVMIMGGMGDTSSGPFFSARRGLSLNAGYTLGRARNNVDGAFSVPASGTIETEWAPSSGDVRHRVVAGLTSNAVKNLSVMFYVQGSTGSPYTVLTGRDENGDLMFNDRPAGVGRNTERAAGQWTSFGNFTYTIGFGKRSLPTVGIDIATIARAAGVSVPSAPAPTPQPRYRLSLSLGVQNLTNHANYVGYSGVMTSPFFGKPTMVQGVRTFNLSASLSF